MNINIKTYSDMKRDFYQLVAVFATCACTLFCSSCASEQTINTSSKDIRYAGCKIELISFDLPQTSFCCFSGMMGDSIYCFDQVLSYLYNISVDGQVGSKRLGYGRGNGELPIRNPLQVCYDSYTNNFWAFGTTNDLYCYDMKKNNITKMDLKPNDQKMSYRSSLGYSYWDEVIIYSDGNFLYSNVEGNDNGVNCRDDYFEEASIFLKTELSTGKQEPIGRYSDFYRENKNEFRHLPHIYFDLDKDKDFYVSFQMDSLIYHYDNKFCLKECYGFQGDHINMDYTVSGCGAESVRNAFKKDRKNKIGYYWMKFVDGYLFRSYRTPKKESYDGMQVYEGNTLIADLKVPKNFRVIGKIGDYYVTEVICSEKKQKTGFYRFKMLSKEETEKMKEEQKK